MNRAKNWFRQYWTLVILLLGLSVISILSFNQFEVDASTFLAIFIPASIGVIGSYGLYLKRTVDSTRRLRKALRSELEGMTWFNNWPDESGGIPAFDPVPSSVYDQNADSLGSLTDKEVTHIVEFYSRAAVMREILGFHQDKVVQAESSLIGQDLNKKDRAKAIVSLLDRLALSQQRALFTLLHQLDDIGEEHPALREDKLIESDHPVVAQSVMLCLEYGLLTKNGSNQYRVTEAGERFFEGEINAGELDKENDLLGRDQAWYDKVLSRLTS